MKRTYFDILQIPDDASAELIKKARNRLALQYHPDKVTEKNKAESAAIFNEINAAYSVLSDPKKSVIYNCLLKARGKDSLSTIVLAAVHSSGLFSDQEAEIIKSSLNARDIQDHLKRPSRIINVQDLNIYLEHSFSLEDAYFGNKKEKQILRSVHCSNCQGTGARNGREYFDCPDCLSLGFGLNEKTAGISCPACGGRGLIIRNHCETCKGKGKRQEKAVITFTVPKGAEEGAVVKVPSEGNRLEHMHGSVHIRLKYSPHRTFIRKGRDLHLTLRIDPVLLLVGGEVDIPTLAGPKKVMLLNKQLSLKLSQSGMPWYSEYHLRYGHLFVTLVPDYEKPVSNDNRRILAQYLANTKRLYPAESSGKKRPWVKKIKSFLKWQEKNHESA